MAGTDDSRAQRAEELAQNLASNIREGRAFAVAHTLDEAAVTIGAPYSLFCWAWVLLLERAAALITNPGSDAFRDNLRGAIETP
jgi:hypothetical protein